MFKLGLGDCAGTDQPKGIMEECLCKGVQHVSLSIVGRDVKFWRDWKKKKKKSLLVRVESARRCLCGFCEGDVIGAGSLC